MLVLIVVTESGMDSDVNPDDWNAETPIVTPTVGLNVTDVKLVHDWNA